MRPLPSVFLTASCVLGVLAHAAVAQPIPDQNGDRGPGVTIPVGIPDHPEVLGAESSATSTIAAPVSLEQPVDANTYICGPGDLFELNFWGKQNFRVRMAADLEGRAFISKVGFVDVAGKKLADVRKDIKKRVRENYPGLQFDVTLISPRSFLVHVVANVKQPGTYGTNPFERVSAIVSRAGGVTGSRRRISIKHRNGDTITADLLLYELTGDVSYDPFVLDGDIITVPAPTLEITISGEVRRPGQYELVGSKDIAEAIEVAGGLTNKVAWQLPITVIRSNDRQQAAVHEVRFSGKRPPSESLVDGDQVVIKSSDELQPMVMVIGAVINADKIDAAETIKRLPYIKGDTVKSLIERAGGLRPTGDLRRAYITRARPKAAAEIIQIDLEALFVRRDLSADKPVSLDDTIVIPPLQYSILIEGAVARPGVYNFNPQFGVPQYLAHAGGLTRTARDMDEVRLIDSDGVTRPYKAGVHLNPGEAILVPERNFTRGEIAQLVLAGAGLLLSGIAITVAATR
jgi:protein involved in polysaccharide export with SLBB domain